MSNSSSPQVSIVIVTWNVRELLRANLARLFSLRENITFEVFVVDNGSNDGTAHMVRELFPQAHLITNDWDAGFAGPNNQALRLAKGEVCILLNPDMLVEEGALTRVYEKITQDRSIGVLGIKLVSKEGKPINSVRHYPDWWSQLLIILKAQHLFPSALKYYLWDGFDFDRSQDVDQVRGSFFVFRRELLETVGYLDEKSYHIWFEEVDYCRRVREKGLRIFHYADAQAHDYVGKGVSQMRRLETQLIFTKSMLNYFRKWHPRWQWWVLACARPIGLAAACVADGWSWLTKTRI
ncbi:MAG: glycosyltransferase family 2 protein [Patescibacteria group bacterium]